MARPRAASWSQFRGSWDCRSGLGESARRRGIYCRLIPKNLWIHCSLSESMMLDTMEQRAPSPVLPQIQTGANDATDKVQFAFLLAKTARSNKTATPPA